MNRTKFDRLRSSYQYHSDLAFHHASRAREFARQIEESMDLLMGSDPDNRVHRIVELVASEYSLTADQIYGFRKFRNNIEARHVAMTLTREVLKITLQECAKAFGRMDHASIVYAMKAVKNSIDTNSEFKTRYDLLFGRSTFLFNDKLLKKS